MSETFDDHRYVVTTRAGNIKRVSREELSAALAMEDVKVWWPDIFGADIHFVLKKSETYT